MNTKIESNKKMIGKTVTVLSAERPFTGIVNSVIDEETVLVKSIKNGELVRRVFLTYVLFKCET